MARLRVVSLVMACCPAALVFADPPDPAPQKIDLSMITQMMSGPGVKPAGDKPDLPDFKDVTKDMESKDGLFTLWFYPPGAKDKDPEKLLCEIPAKFLGEKFMLSTSFSGGGFFTGFPLEERVVEWELLGKQLLLIEPETRFVIDPKKEVSDVVQRTYPERIRAAVSLVTKSPDGNPVIDLGTLLKSDFADIGWMSFLQPMPAMVAQRINPGLSKWTKKKTFPHNVEIGVELAVGRLSPPGSFDKKLVHFSFWKLPASDYTPRIADDRIGYFLTTNQDWSKPTDARDLFNRYIDRWHLAKRDASLKLCEPRQPIIFYIEKTVPVRFRRAVRDGILEWNEAFEKIGFLNAVEVRQQEDDNEWKDLDPEDMRYSFFRWIVTGAGFAMGPHRANPFTGQIYDADIIFDDSMVRYFEQSAERLMPEAVVAGQMSDPALQQFFAEYPEFSRPRRGDQGIVLNDGEDNDLPAKVLQSMRRRGRQCCDYQRGMRHHMAVAHAVLADQPREVRDKFLYDIIKEVVMHEVGHTLGLRHNFKASSIYTLDEIKKRRTTDQATVGSVMDYNPALFTSDGLTDGHFITPTIGPYDHWAIEYGYRPADGSYAAKDVPSETADPENKKEQPAAPQQAAAMQVDPEQVQQVLKQVPADVLEKLPPEIRKMIESGEAQTMISQAMPAGITPPAGGGPAAAGAAAFKSAPSGEEKMLLEIAGRAAEPELAYATDEDTTFYGVDPLSNRFDIGRDPVDWARDRIALVDKRMDNILEWAAKDQESWYHVRQAFLSLMIEKSLVLDYVGRFIGGQYFHRSHRGDKDAPPPFVLVQPQLQREALGFLEDTLFGEGFFDYDAEVLNHLAPPRWWHSGSYVSYTMDFPLRDYISVLQWWNLFDRLFPNTLRRIHDAELKSAAADKFTAAEYLQRLQKGCWKEVAEARGARNRPWTDAEPLISDSRRSLQREYLNLVEPLVRYKPGTVLSPDLHAMVRYALVQLHEQIGQALDAGKIDFSSRAHLDACRSRIERLLAPELKEYEASATAMF